MNLVGKLSISGGKGGGAADWEDLKDKPFETLGDDFKVENGELQLAAEPVVEVDWDDIQNKPAFATVATSGDYDDLSNKPIIPVVPTDVSAFNNDAGYITEDALDGYATEQYVDNAIADIPSIEIDNKSLIEVNGVVQEAVPLYTEAVYDDITLNTAPVAYNDSWTKAFGGDYGQYLYNNGRVVGANYTVYFKFNYVVEGTIINTVDTVGYVTITDHDGVNNTWANGAFTENSPCRDYNFNSFTLVQHTYGSEQSYGNIRLSDSVSGTEASKYKLVYLSVEELQNSQFDNTNETYHIYVSDIVHQLPSQYIKIDNDTIKVNSDGEIYADVSGDVDWSDITNKPTFATVATSGDYNDLSNTPTIPTVPSDVSAFNNDAGYITSTALTPYVEASSLATVATSGDYDDLSNKPTIPEPTSVTVTQTLSSGTEIGQIDVDGTTTVLYAPSGGGGSTAWADITGKPIDVSTGTNSLAAQGGIASGTNSIKIGTGVQSWRVASGEGAIVIGDGRATQQYTIHIGNGTESSAGALATRAIAIGNAGAIGNQSIAIGNYVKAKGPHEVAIGEEINQVFDSTLANYMYGQGLQQYAYNGSALTKCGYRGYFNKASNGVQASISYLDILGNGTGAQAANRNNAEATDWSGNKYLAGDIYVNVTDWTNPQANSIKLANIPAAPTTAGTYSLQVVVDASGNPTYSWI